MNRSSFLLRPLSLSLLVLAGACGGAEFTEDGGSAGDSAGGASGQAGASAGGAGQGGAQGGSSITGGQAGSGGSGGAGLAGEAGDGGQSGGAGAAGGGAGGPGGDGGTGGSIAGQSGQGGSAGTAGQAGAGGGPPAGGNGGGGQSGMSGAGGAVSCVPDSQSCSDSGMLVTCDTTGSTVTELPCPIDAPVCQPGAPGQAQCVGCVFNEDCKPTGEPDCVLSVSCNQGKCQQFNRSDGYELPDPSPHDCHNYVCKADGSAEIRVDPNDSPAQDQPCTVRYCGGTGAIGTKPIQTPTPCEGGYCTRFTEQSGPGTCCKCDTPQGEASAFIPGCAMTTFSAASVPADPSSGDINAIVDGKLSSSWTYQGSKVVVTLAPINDTVFSIPSAVDILIAGKGELSAPNFAINVAVSSNGQPLGQASLAAPNGPAKLRVPLKNLNPITSLTLSFSPDLTLLNTETAATWVEIHEITQETCN